MARDNDETSPAPSDAIRGRDIRAWWQPALSIGVFLAGAGMAYTSLTTRLTLLESRVTIIEQKGSDQAQDALRRVAALENVSRASADLQRGVDGRLSRIEDQLGAIVCLLDKQRCAERLHGGAGRP